jgi:hypothetical protein
MDLLTLLRATRSMLFTQLHSVFHSSPSINSTPSDRQPRLAAANAPYHHYNHRSQSPVVVSMTSTSYLPSARTASTLDGLPSTPPITAPSTPSNTDLCTLLSQSSNTLAAPTITKPAWRKRNRTHSPQAH